MSSNLRRLMVNYLLIGRPSDHVELQVNEELNFCYSFSSVFSALQTKH